MKLFIITYSTSERSEASAIRGKNGVNYWLHKDVASEVLKETYEAELENAGGKTVFNRECYDTSARIEYEDGSWTEYRIVQMPILLLEMEINQSMEDHIKKEITEKETARIYAFIENAYLHDEADLPLDDYAKVINYKLQNGKTVEEVCSQGKWDFLTEVGNYCSYGEMPEED